MTLAQWVNASRGRLLKAWRARTRTALALRKLDDEALQGRMSAILDEVAMALARVGVTSVTSPLPHQSPSAKAHARLRLEQGFDCGGLVREFAALEAAFFALLAEDELTPTRDELALWSESLATAAAEAAEAFAADHAKHARATAARMLGSFAHELRNALNTARLALSLMERDAQLSSSHGKALARAHRRLRALVEDGLVGAWLETRVELKPQRLSLEPLLTELIADAAIEAERKQISVELEVSDGLTLDADPRLLHAALSNLISNAVKFTHARGRVRIRANAVDDRVLIAVADECGGIPEEKLAELFAPFVQVGIDRSGFGMGLFIVKEAAEAAGGALRVHNRGGDGCVFTLDLQGVNATASPRMPEPTTAGSLLAEDEAAGHALHEP